MALSCRAMAKYLFGLLNGTEKIKVSGAGFKNRQRSKICYFATTIE